MHIMVLSDLSISLSKLFEVWIPTHIIAGIGQEDFPFVWELYDD